jgi:transposase
MHYLGFDVSKSDSRFVILDDQGERFAKAFTLQNDKPNFQKLLERLKELNLSKENLLIGIEATGIWWENLYSYLTEAGFKVVVLNPHQTNKFREALRKKAKTDDIDAYIIAGLLRSKEYASSYVPEELIQTLRELTRLRYELIKDRRNYERQAASLLSLVFPEYEKTAIKNPFAIASTAILKAYPTAKDLSLAKPKHIEKIVRSIKGNNFNIDEIQELIDTARDSIYSGRAKDARGLNLCILLSHIEHIDESIKELDVNIENLLSPTKADDINSFPGANLLTIPGIGPKTLVVILQAVGSNGQVFASGIKLIGHIGFFPQIYESGETRTDNRISQRGPKMLRWAFYIAAVACLRHNQEMRTLYNKKLSQGKTAKQALICVAKKLAHLCLSMLKSGEPYKPQRVFVCA